MAKRKKKAKPTLKIGGWNDQGEYVMGSDIKTIHPERRVLLVALDNLAGDPLADLPAMGLTMDWNALTQRYGSTNVWVNNKLAREEVRFPFTNESFVVTVDTNVKAWKKRPMMCVFDAAKNYCGNLLGVALSSEDTTFFEEHPLVDVDGVPFPHTLRVVQELIDPYRLRISRVQIAQHYNIKGDVLQWRRVLGCNPLALNDRSTTNAQFAEQVGGGGIVGPFGFEYSDTPLTPSILCGTAWATLPGVTTGSSGGHATYVPPRRNTGPGLLSFQIDHAGNAVWKKPPVFDPLPEATPNLVKVFDLNAWYKLYGSSYKAKTTTTVVPVAKDKAPVKKWEFNPHECYVCETPVDRQRHALKVPGLCDACWELLCSLFYCATATCLTKLDVLPVFHSYDWDEGRIYTQCPTCSLVAWVDKTYGARVLHALQALRAYSIDLKISQGLDTGVLSADTLPAPATPPAPPAEPTAPTPDDPFDGMSGWGD